MSSQRIQPQAMVTGEKSIIFKFGDNEKVEQDTYLHVLRFAELVQKDNHYLLEEIVPSYQTVTVYLKKEPLEMEEIIHRLLSKWKNSRQFEEKLSSRKITIPVCYEEPYSLDIERVMEQNNLNRDEVIALHSGTTYTVYMIGFLPGFPYLGKLDERLATPRLHTPRFQVEKGAVGIGGQQTGIYPLDSPGGWNIIGKTPLDLFHPEREEPFFIQAGDQLEFYPITMSEYQKIKLEMDDCSDAVQRFIRIEEER
jgi:inhibitor of KinA